MGRLQGQSVSLIFSSYFINNPSSAFGHTFLKINKSEDFELDLLNYGINYAATVDTKNAFFYAFKGLLGFFPGEFTAVPYYYKVREYNDYESRDLWEYQLNLTPSEVLFLNLHIWELGTAWSWYYFLDKNCSYWAIRVLEAVRPDLNLEPYFKSAFVVPIETVKSVLKTKGLVKNIKYRPSLRQQLLDRFKHLNKSEIKNLIELTEALNSGEALNLQYKNYSPEFLKTSLLYFDYTNAKNYVAEEDKLLKKKQPLLQALSRMKVTQEKSQSVDLKTDAPHFSHPPRRLSLGYQNQNFNNFYEQGGLNLKYKQGFHEMMDSNRGFNPHTSLNYLDLSLILNDRIDEGASDSSDQSLVLDHLYIISIDAFMPINKLESNFSWRVKLGLDAEQFLRDWTQTVGFISFDSGLAKSFFRDESLLLYFLVSNTLEANGRFINNVRYGLSPLLGLKYAISQDSNLLFEAKPLWVTDFSNSAEYVSQTTLSFQNHFQKLNLSLSLDGSYLKPDEITAYNFATTLNYYF